MKNKLLKLIGLSFSNALCAQPSVGSLEDVSRNLMEPLTVFTGTTYNIILVIGIAFLGGALIQYKNYRDNPSQTPINRSIFLLIFGLILIAVPLIAKLSSSARLVS